MKNITQFDIFLQNVRFAPNKDYKLLDMKYKYFDIFEKSLSFKPEEKKSFIFKLGLIITARNEYLVRISSGVNSYIDQSLYY